MKDFTHVAKSIVKDLEFHTDEDRVIIINECMKQAYILGKKHLIEPHIMCDGNHVVTIEKDTYNPQA